MISGPAIPDITITLSAIFFLIYIIYDKKIKHLIEYNWFKVSIFFWLYLLFASLFAFNIFEAFSNSLIFIRYLMIPIILIYFVLEDNFFKKKIITIIFFSILFVILDVFYQFLNYDSFNGFKSDIFGYVPDFAKFNRLTGPFKDLVLALTFQIFIGLIFLFFILKIFFEK